MGGGGEGKGSTLSRQIRAINRVKQYKVPIQGKGRKGEGVGVSSSQRGARVEAGGWRKPI